MIISKEYAIDSVIIYNLYCISYTVCHKINFKAWSLHKDHPPAWDSRNLGKSSLIKLEIKKSAIDEVF